METLLKVAREKLPEGKHQSNNKISDLKPTEVMENEPAPYFSSAKRKWLWILYPVKISFRNEGEIEMFSDK